MLATQNSIELEGTYPLPEAQLDRFLFKIVLEQYRAAYARHFSLWEEQALRYRVPMARVDGSKGLAWALWPHTVEWRR